MNKVDRVFYCILLHILYELVNEAEDAKESKLPESALGFFGGSINKLSVR